MTSFYIDTCSLKWRYLNGNCTAVINGILDAPGNTVFTSELTILEWSSALAWAVREHHIDKGLFKSNEMALFTDIAQQSIRVFKITRFIERARFWIEFVGVVHKRGLRSYDAIHLTAALELASRLKQQVEFVTSDRKLASIVADFPAFSTHLTSRFVNPV